MEHIIWMHCNDLKEIRYEGRKGGRMDKYKRSYTLMIYTIIYRTLLYYSRYMQINLISKQLLVAVSAWLGKFTVGWDDIVAWLSDIKSET